MKPRPLAWTGMNQAFGLKVCSVAAALFVICIASGVRSADLTAEARKTQRFKIKMRDGDAILIICDRECNA